MENTSSGIVVSLKELIDLRLQAIYRSFRLKNNLRQLSGQKLIPLRGRGIEFNTMREYQAGDDIRSMAWRLTAKSAKPYVKIYHEAKEQSLWLAVDFSPSLYFGTRGMFKSVRAIKEAACLGWSNLLKGERIGAILAGAEKTHVFQPQSGEQHFLKILNSFSKESTIIPTYLENKNYLYTLLQTLQLKVRTGHRVFILSDFLVFDDEIKKLILHIAKRAEVILIFIYDPFEAESPPPNTYMLTDGSQKIIFNMSNAENRQHYQQQFLNKKNELFLFVRKHPLLLEIVCTNQ